jgi:hypothetical protein
MRPVRLTFGIAATAAAALLASGGPAGAQGSPPVSGQASNITPGDTGSPIAPPLPAPPVADDSGPAAFLRAARVALAGGRSGEAQEALERAESRLLDRSVPYGHEGDQDMSRVVAEVAQARRALGSGNTPRALQLVDTALAAVAGPQMGEAGLPAAVAPPPAVPYPPVPPLQAEQVPPPPGPRHVWEPGHWQWQDGRYIWVSGHYFIPPAAYAHYAHGHWVQSGGAWIWIPAHWE